VSLRTPGALDRPAADGKPETQDSSGESKMRGLGRALTLAVVGAVVWALPCRAQPVSLFGSEWPPLEQCLEFSEETGAWSWKGSAKTIEREHPSGENVYFHFGRQRIQFDPDGTFALTFSCRVTRRNKYWRTKSVKAEEKIARKGTWTLTHRPLTRQERKMIPGGVPDALRIYFLELEFRDNDNPTLYERGENVAIDGPVTFVLDETREYLDAKGRIKPVPDATNPARLKWICVANPEGIMFFDQVPAPYVLVHSP
jgi:hypothetical protein